MSFFLQFLYITNAESLNQTCTPNIALQVYCNDLGQNLLGLGNTRPQTWPNHTDFSELSHIDALEAFCN
jgi:hypothetical protein